jgi:hypothetical protein
VCWAAKAVDYAEVEQTMAESAGRTELTGHRGILQSLDIDVAAVMIGGVRHTLWNGVRRGLTINVQHESHTQQTGRGGVQLEKPAGE